MQKGVQLNMDNQSTNQFKLYIPSEISSDSNLNLSEMKILSSIKALDNQNNCYASNSYLAECTSLSVRQVSRVIKSLETKGYIEIENGKSFRRKIKMAKVVEQEQVNAVDPVATAEPVKEETKVMPINKLSTFKSKVSSKIKQFNTMLSHEWDFDVIGRLEALKIDLKLGLISEDKYMELASPLLAIGG